jgi:hypothetical protein
LRYTPVRRRCREQDDQVPQAGLIKRGKKFRWISGGWSDDRCPLEGHPALGGEPQLDSKRGLPPVEVPPVEQLADPGADNALAVGGEQLLDNIAYAAAWTICDFLQDHEMGTIGHEGHGFG